MHRRVLPLLVSLSLGVLSSGCASEQHGSTSSAATSDPCADFQVQVERYWSASIRAKALEHAGELEVEKRSGVVNKMDRISEDWVMMRTSVCKDHYVRQLIDADEYAARVRCFDDRLDRQRTIATALTDEVSIDLVAGWLDTLAAQPASCDQTPSTDQDPT